LSTCSCAVCGPIGRCSPRRNDVRAVRVGGAIGPGADVVRTHTHTHTLMRTPTRAVQSSKHPRQGVHEPGPGADVASTSPVPTWQARAQSRCRRGRGERSPGADVGSGADAAGQPSSREQRLIRSDKPIFPGECARSSGRRGRSGKGRLPRKKPAATAYKQRSKQTNKQTTPQNPTRQRSGPRRRAPCSPRRASPHATWTQAAPRSCRAG
jgi:hypothetical protein